MAAEEYGLGLCEKHTPRQNYQCSGGLRCSTIPVRDWVT